MEATDNSRHATIDTRLGRLHLQTPIASAPDVKLTSYAKVVDSDAFGGCTTEKVTSSGSVASGTTRLRY
jgi:hypothetical protein